MILPPMMRLLCAARHFYSADDAADVLEQYTRMHRNKLGMHWIYAAIGRIAAGDNEDEVMGDYGWVRKDER